MSTAKALSILKAVGQVFGLIVFVICLVFFRSISWALALLFVILGIAGLVGSLSMWPAVACFAALVAQHLIISFYPIESLARRAGIQKKTRS
jgi:hypothetical protein